MYGVYGYSWYPAHRRPWTEIHILAKGGWVAWAGILTFMYLAYIRGCYAAATLLRIFGTLGRPPAAGLMLSDEEKQKQILA